MSGAKEGEANMQRLEGPMILVRNWGPGCYLKLFHTLTL